MDRPGKRSRKAATRCRVCVRSTLLTNDLAQAIRRSEKNSPPITSNRAGQNRSEFRVHVEGISRELAPILSRRSLPDCVRSVAQCVPSCAARADRSGNPLRTTGIFGCGSADNGKGIDPQVLSEGGRPGHFGLAGMHERARAVGGKLVVRGRLDSGTEAEPARTAVSAEGA